jgi:hypothetical protein
MASLATFLLLVATGFGAVLVAASPPVRRRLRQQAELQSSTKHQAPRSDDRQILAAAVHDAARLGRRQETSAELRVVQATVQEADRLGLGDERPDLVLALMERIRRDLRLHRRQPADVEGLVADLMARVYEIQEEQRLHAETEREST